VVVTTGFSFRNIRFYSAYKKSGFQPTASEKKCVEHAFAGIPRVPLSALLRRRAALDKRKLTILHGNTSQFKRNTRLVKKIIFSPTPKSVL